MNLLNLFEQLKANKLTAPYTVSPIEDMSGAFLGLDENGRPCIFITTEHDINMPAIKTDKIKVEFSKKYKLLITKNTEEKIYNSILCLSSDLEDSKTFIVVMESILANIRGEITIQLLREMFQALVNLFSVKVEQDVLSARRGLWAELFFMQQNEGFLFWAPLWHSEPTRTFDFSANGLRTEIKSTIRQERIHEFSHQQLISIADERIIVVSYLLQEDDSGTSLQTLIDAAKAALKGTQYYIKLERAIRVVGMGEMSEQGPKFNGSYVTQNAGWFKSTDIPRFPINEPSGVSGTHYQSDLTQAPKLTQEQISSWINDVRNASEQLDS